MKIPRNTISVSQLRTYGAGDVRTDDHEEDKGCPRKWKAKYVDRVKETERSYPLIYGSMFHRVMENIVAHDADPREAVLDAIEPDASVEMIDELLKDLETYMARPSADTDEMAVMGTEVDVKVPLYDDPEHGTIYFRAIIDVIMMDPDDPGTIRIKDYKSNRSPISSTDLEGDTQMRGYAWAVKQLSERWTDVPNPRIVVHLDLVKFRDYVYEYDDDQIDAWHTWAVAMTRTILRDEEAKPVINPNCSTCIVRHDCPALLALPEDSLLTVEGARAITGGDMSVEALEEARRWRDKANAARLALEKVVTAWDEDFGRLVASAGPVTLNGSTFTVEPADKTKVDVFAVARLLGDDFPKVATVSKAAVERSSLDESTKAQALSYWYSEVDGTKLFKRKAKP